MPGFPHKPTQTSAEGRSAIRKRETDVAHYEGHHGKLESRKYSIGSLTHHEHHEGHKTSKPVEHHHRADHIDTKLSHAIHKAEQVVHRYVKHFTLTQAQFDALVSYVVSVGDHHARAALHAANRGDHHGTAKHIEQSVYLHHHSAEKPGSTHAPVRSRFLAIRRQDEAIPFYHSGKEEHSHAAKHGPWTHHSHGESHSKKGEQKSVHHSDHVFAKKPKHPFAHHSDHAHNKKSSHPSQHHGWDPFKVFTSKR